MSMSGWESYKIHRHTVVVSQLATPKATRQATRTGTHSSVSQESEGRSRRHPSYFIFCGKYFLSAEPNRLKSPQSRAAELLQQRAHVQLPLLHRPEGRLHLRRSERARDE